MGLCLAQLGEEENGGQHLHNAASLLDYIGRHEEAAQMMQNARSQLGSDFLDSQSLPGGFTGLSEEELGEVGGGFTRGDFLPAGIPLPVAASS